MIEQQNIEATITCTYTGTYVLVLVPGTGTYCTVAIVRIPNRAEQSQPRANPQGKTISAFQINPKVCTCKEARIVRLVSLVQYTRTHGTPHLARRLPDQTLATIINTPLWPGLCF